MPIAIRHTVSLAALTFAIVALVVGVAVSVGLGLITAAVTAAMVAAWVGATSGRVFGQIAATAGAASTSSQLRARVDAMSRSLRDAESRAQHLARGAVQERQLVQDVIDNTVHELRTPLTTVLSSIEMIRSGMLEDPIEVSELVEYAHSACHHMQFMINDLLDASALRSGKLHLDTRFVEPFEIIRAAQRILHPIATVRSMDLVFECDESTPMVTADEMRTQQVLFNLVGNALKYANENTRVTVRVCAEDGRSVRFEVEDEGPGIAANRRSELFGRFVRVHESNGTSVSGTGIGLNFSKLMVECMDGEIGYRPRQDVQGSVFWFALPLADQAEVDRGALAADAS